MNIVLNRSEQKQAFYKNIIYISDIMRSVEKTINKGKNDVFKGTFYPI